MSGYINERIADVTWAIIQIAMATLSAAFALAVVVIGVAFVYYRVRDWRDDQRYRAQERARRNQR